MADIVLSHVVSATHDETVLEGALAVGHTPVMVQIPLADGEATPEADVVAVTGTLLFRSLTDANVFVEAAAADLVCEIQSQGQAQLYDQTFVNARAIGYAGEYTIQSKGGPVPTVGVTFEADSVTTEAQP